MTVSSFDLLVLGAGSGGIGTAIRAARHGARVALLDPGPFGGTCVNAGCVPKKAMWLAARLASLQQTARQAGFATIAGPLDWPAYVARREAYIGDIHASYRAQFEAAGIEVVRESGRFLAPGVVATPTREFRAAHVVVATGSRPRPAEIHGGHHAIDSDGFFGLRAAPPRVAIIGGGYVACELAGVLHALGSEVELFVRGEALLTHFDADMVEHLVGIMRGRGIGVTCGRTLAAISRSDRAGLALSFEETAAAESGFDSVIWAAGRTPNTATLDLAAAGIAVDATGHIVVDDRQDTNVVGIHAVGDVTGRVALTPVAVAAGRRLADRLFGGQPEACLDYRDIPSVCFGAVPVGAVGLTEAAARERHGDAVRVYRTRFRPMLNAIVGCDERVAIKLICFGDDERIVGIHLAGDGVDEILQGFAVAMKAGARKADLDATVAIHPTAAEELVLLR